MGSNHHRYVYPIGASTGHPGRCQCGREGSLGEPEPEPNCRVDWDAADLTAARPFAAAFVGGERVTSQSYGSALTVYVRGRSLKVSPELWARAIREAVDPEVCAAMVRTAQIEVDRYRV